MGKTEPQIQAGVIPFRHRPDGEMQVLLVTSRSGAGWIVPKGKIDPGKDAKEAAEIEALEEAGLLGTTGDEVIGHYEFEKLDRAWRVMLFAMRVHRVLERWPEMDERKREWVSVDEAIRRVSFPGLRDALGRLEHIHKAPAA
ncbi:MAG: NUDIX hydrolase [Phycisphaerales bacterium]